MSGARIRIECLRSSDSDILLEVLNNGEDQIDARRVCADQCATVSLSAYYELRITEIAKGPPS